VPRAAAPGDTKAVIDRSMINDLLDVGLGEDFVGQFVDDSLRDIAVVFERVKEAASSGNRLGFRDEIHTLRGIAMKSAHCVLPGPRKVSQARAGSSEPGGSGLCGAARGAGRRSTRGASLSRQ
jgi:hypothetical protein